MTLSFKWIFFFSQRHHTTFVDKKK